MLFKNFFCRNFVVSGSVSSPFKVLIAFGYALGVAQFPTEVTAFLSTVITRGDWVCVNTVQLVPQHLSEIPPTPLYKGGK